MFRRVVNVIEYVAVALAATFFVLLFVYQPSTPSPSTYGSMPRSAFLSVCSTKPPSPPEFCCG